MTYSLTCRSMKKGIDEGYINEMPVVRGQLLNPNERYSQSPKFQNKLQKKREIFPSKDMTGRGKVHNCAFNPVTGRHSQNPNSRTQKQYFPLINLRFAFAWAS
jgi:hypothetical protein